MVSCTSNTIYEKPKDLIPKDSMIDLLTDMYLASAATNNRNSLINKEANYMMLVYKKYQIDTTRFYSSNNYYTSLIDEYAEILGAVKKRIDSLDKKYRKERSVIDSIKAEERLLKNKDKIETLDLKAIKSKKNKGKLNLNKFKSEKSEEKELK